MEKADLPATLASALGGRWTVRALAASGFCATWEARSQSDRLFVKSAGSPAPMLRAEADGLRALAATAAIRVPAVALDAGDVLALEWLDLQPPGAGFGPRFGEALARLHRALPPFAGYGWPRDNFIGVTPQANTPCGHWPDFFAGSRLRAMTARLRDAEVSDAVEQVIACLPLLFDDGHVPRPSIVHGDLWQGNWGQLADGTPVIYDPAVACCDAEYELAMMELFGSLPAGFIDAYRDSAGLHEGYPRRRPLYQLYHLLNHAVLFGGGYRAQALRCAAGISGARAAG